jgi:hypothetical protein
VENGPLCGPSSARREDVNFGFKSGRDLSESELEPFNRNAEATVGRRESAVV